MKKNLINGIFGLFCVFVMGYAVVVQVEEETNKKEKIAKEKVMKIAKDIYFSK